VAEALDRADVVVPFDVTAARDALPLVVTVL
jgi:hypothetical protein